jgi:hypothetical protein
MPWSEAPPANFRQPSGLKRSRYLSGRRASCLSLVMSAAGRSIGTCSPCRESASSIATGLDASMASLKTPERRLHLVRCHSLALHSPSERLRFSRYSRAAPRRRLTRSTQNGLQETRFARAGTYCHETLSQRFHAATTSQSFSGLSRQSSCYFGRDLGTRADTFIPSHSMPYPGESPALLTLRTYDDVLPAFTSDQTSNHAMERTADRCALHFKMISTLPPRATRTLVRRRSSCSR